MIAPLRPPNVSKPKIMPPMTITKTINSMAKKKAAHEIAPQPRLGQVCVSILPDVAVRNAGANQPRSRPIRTKVTTVRRRLSVHLTVFSAGVAGTYTSPSSNSGSTRVVSPPTEPPGKARVAKLTPEQRQEIARKAANARWKKSE